MTTRLPVLAAAALIFIGACTDSLTPTTTPAGLSPGGDPSKSISDGFHSGNPNFFFLVPTLPATSSGSSFKLGTFNPNLQPEVVICQLATTTTYPLPTDPCVSGAPVADLKSPTNVHVVITPATTFETSLKTTYSLPADGFYYTIWNTSSASLTPNKFYRISVQTGAGQLGFVDIVPEPTGTGLFQLLNAVTHQVVPTLQNGTIPIIFRIQNGATCWPVTSCVETTVPNTGGTFQLGTQTGTLVTAPSGLNDGKDGAKAFFPNHFLDGVVDANGNAITQIDVTIRQVSPIVGNDCQNPALEGNASLLQFPTCYNFSVSPQPANPWHSAVTVSTCPSLSSTSTVGDLTQLWASDNGQPAHPLAPSIMPMACENGTFTVGLIQQPSNSLLRLARNALGALGRGFSRVFGPRDLYAWDVGVGGLDTGPGLSIISWAMIPVVAVQLAPTATVSSVVPVTATVTTDHDLGPGSNVKKGQLVQGVAVTFAVTAGNGVLGTTPPGGEGPAIAAAAATVPTITVTTDQNGQAVAYLTVASGSATVTASINDVTGTRIITSQAATIVGQAVVGTILGTVRDASGAVVSAANVTVTNEQTEQPAQATTDATGHYSVGSLPPGTYTVAVSIAGSSPLSKSGVPVNGNTVTVDLAPTPSGFLLFGTNSVDDGLSVINLSTGAPAFIGALSLGHDASPISMAARSTDGALFTWDNAIQALISIDMCTGLGTVVNPDAGPQGVTNDMAFGSDGTLYGVQQVPLRLVTIDASAGTVLTSQPLTINGQAVGNTNLLVKGIDFGPGGQLYGLGNGTLYTINTATGALTAVAVLNPIPSGILQGLAFDGNGNLFGSSSTEFFQIEPSTGLVTNQHNVNPPQGMKFARSHCG